MRTAQHSTAQHSVEPQAKGRNGGRRGKWTTLTHQGMGREAVFNPGVAKKQDLGPKLTAKNIRLAKMKETRNRRVLMASSITLHTTHLHVNRV